MWSWWAVAARAGCPDPAGPEALAEALAEGDLAVQALDRGALAHALEDADAALRCQSGPTATATVARWFGLRGILAFVDGQTRSALDAFAAARDLGGWEPPGSLAGALTQTWTASSEIAVDWSRELPVPATGTLAVDGRPSPTAPSNRAFLLQHVDGAVSGWILERGAPWPPALTPPATPPAPRPEPPATPPIRRHRSVPLAVAGGAGLVVGGALGGVATAWAHRYPEADFADQAAADRWFKKTNVAGYAAYGLLGVGAAAGAGAVVVGEW